MKKNIRLPANPLTLNLLLLQPCIVGVSAKASRSFISTSQVRSIFTTQTPQRPHHDGSPAVRPGSHRKLKLIDVPSLNGVSTARSKYTSAPKLEDGGGETKERFILSRTSRHVVGAIALSAFLAYLYNQYSSPDQARIFDPPRFTPFTIIRREEVSPTSIVLTVRPVILPAANADPYRNSWESGTWSLEAKQPQLQIARSYTPLPPRDGDRKEDLRFLIRKEHKGEVSGYLHKLPVGGILQLRGPTVELGLSEHLNEVVFLAGGTGIAPALQLVHCLLERKIGEGELPFIRIVWANRRREDCVEGSENVRSPVDPGYIVRELKHLQQQHPQYLAVEYLVDEEGTRINQQKISQLTSSGVQPNAESSRLLVISGPEGFINFCAGPKIWEGGKEGQGEIGGILGKICLKDWQVWKL